MNNIYRVNPLAVIFHPKFDEINDYKIWVYNSETNEMLKINKTGYKILKKIDQSEQDSGGLNLIQIIQKTKEDNPNLDLTEDTILPFINIMVENNVVQFQKG